MLINLKLITNLLIGLSLFTIINTPSIKIMYSSEIINIIGFLGLTLCGLMRILMEKKLTITKTQLYFLIIGMLLWMSLFLSSIFSRYSAIGTIEIFQYASVFFIFIFSSLFVRYEDLKYYLFIQVSWSLIISYFQLNNLIKINEELGQHYLTLGLPIGLGLVSAMGFLFYTKKWSKRMLWILISLIMLNTLLTLNGRSPILFSLITIVIFWSINILQEKQMKTKLRNFVILIASGTIVTFVLLTQMGEQLLNRFLRINTSFESEPRYHLYKYTLEYILEKPFGYGLNSYWLTNLGSYPHNIFLEITFYSGIVGLFLFISLLLMNVKIVWRFITDKYLNVMCMIAMFALLIWNVSYSLSSSYIVFCTLAVAVASASNTKYILKENT